MKNIVIVIIAIMPIYLLGQMPKFIVDAPWGLATMQGQVSIDFADFNGDGNIDIVMARNTDPYVKISIAYSDGGSLASLGDIVTSPDKVFTYTLFKGDIYIGAGDLDDDGDTDIIISTTNGFSPSATTKILKNTGSLSNPSFTIMSTSIANQFVRGLPSIIDLNQDSLPDIAISNIRGKIELYENEGNLEFNQIPTPAGFESFKSIASFSSVDIDNNDEAELLSFSVETGFKVQKGDEYSIDSVVLSTFIDPGLGTNYLYEMRYIDFDNNQNTDLFLSAFSYSENSGYITKFYLIKDIQECKDIRYIVEVDNPLSFTYKAASKIILQDSLYLGMNKNLNLSAKNITLEGYLSTVNQDDIIIDSLGCKLRGYTVSGSGGGTMNSSNDNKN